MYQSSFGDCDKHTTLEQGVDSWGSSAYVGKGVNGSSPYFHSVLLWTYSALKKKYSIFKKLQVKVHV